MKAESDFIASPCVRNCCLDELDICLGCGRHLEEIKHWSTSPVIEKQQILALAKVRLAKRRYSPFL